jgi:hypothetical protein
VARIIWIIVRLIAASLLFWAVSPHSHGFYTMLRWVICGIGVYSMFMTSEYTDQYPELKGWQYVFALMVLTFNPILVLSLPREGWIVLDVLAALLMVASVLSIHKKPRPRYYL